MKKSTEGLLQHPAKLIAGNRRAFRDYHISERIEAGLSLRGTEVKSLRQGKASLQEGWIAIESQEAFLVDVHIPPYTHGSDANHSPFRKRKLLLHRRQIQRLGSKVREKGFTLIPLRLYFSKKGKVKIEIGLAKGKAQYDKRESMRKKQDEKEVAQAISRRRK